MPNPTTPQQAAQDKSPKHKQALTKRITAPWKIAGVLAILGLFLAVLLLVPALRKPPAPDESMRLPSMSNVPPPGSLSVEVEPDKNAKPSEGAEN